jgi:hypothetical protein
MGAMTRRQPFPVDKLPLVGGAKGAAYVLAADLRVLKVDK